MKRVLQDLHNCCSSSLGRYAVIGCKLKQNANESCNSCACATVVQVLQDLF